MARRNSRGRRALAATTAFVLALSASTSGAAAARVLRGETTATTTTLSGARAAPALTATTAAATPSSGAREALPSFPVHSSYGTYHGVQPDMGPTGDLMHGPGAAPGKSSHKPDPAVPPARGSLALIQGSLAVAEARRDGSGFEAMEPENVVAATAGNVRMTRVQTENSLPKGLMYTGTPMENVVGGRMAVIAATANGARAQAISGGRPIASRYGATPQAASLRMMGGVPISTKYPVAVAGSSHVHSAAVSGTADETGVIASTPNVQAISLSG